MPSRLPGGSPKPYQARIGHATEAHTKARRTPQGARRALAEERRRRLVAVEGQARAGVRPLDDERSERRCLRASLVARAEDGRGVLELVRPSFGHCAEGSTALLRPRRHLAFALRLFDAG